MSRQKNFIDIKTTGVFSVQNFCKVSIFLLLCFSDVVFFIFLYQRYIYRVDPKRVNEFGTSADMFDENGKLIMNGEADSIADGTAPAIEGAEQQEPKSAEEKKKD